MEKESIVQILPIFLFLVLVCLLLILAENFGLTKPVWAAFERLTVPLKTSIYRTGQKATKNFSVLTYFQDRALKDQELEERTRELQALTARLKVLEEENKALRRQLEAPLPPSLKFLPAKTIGLTRYLVIDKGEEEGLRRGMTVVLGNIMVGKILSVSPHSAQVLLPFDPDSKIPARTINSGARGLVIGEFGTKIIFDKVLQKETLEFDDLVVTTGEGEFVRDLLIGKVGEVEKVEVEPFQRAKIVPLLDYEKLIDVFVVSNN